MQECLRVLPHRSQQNLTAKTPKRRSGRIRQTYLASKSRRATKVIGTRRVRLSKHLCRGDVASMWFWPEDHPPAEANRALRRRLARIQGRRRRPYRPPTEDTRRQVRLLEYEFRKEGDAGFEAFARLAAERNRFRRDREEEAA